MSPIDQSRSLKLGTTSYAFRYLLQNCKGAVPLDHVIELTKSHGLDRLQICENARPIEISIRDWQQLVRRSADMGVEVELGCKTLNLDMLRLYLERAAETQHKMLRIVLEQDGGEPPQRSQLEAFVDSAAKMLEQGGVRLAIENYFQIPSRILAGIVAHHSSPRVGFCIDSANSLRSFETPEQVLRLLGPRAFCYHIKDYKVTGDNVGFCVTGAPLGKGAFALDDFLSVAFGFDPSPRIYLENWVPATGNIDADVEADANWLHQAVVGFKERLRLRGSMI